LLWRFRFLVCCWGRVLSLGVGRATWHSAFSCCCFLWWWGVGCGGALLGPEGTGCMWFLRGLRGGCVWCVFLVPLLSVCSYRVPGVLVGVGGCVGGVWLFFEMCIVDASIWFVVIVLVYSVLW